MQPDYSDNTAILATAKLIGFPVSDETSVFRMRDTVDFAYWDYARNGLGYTKLKHYRSSYRLQTGEPLFDLWMGFAFPINTIAVYIPTEAASYDNHHPNYNP